MKKETVDLLNSKTIPENTENHAKVGIVSVRKRLEILYGDQGELLVQSEIGRGTCVYISYPVTGKPGEKDTLKY